MDLGLRSLLPSRLPQAEQAASDGRSALSHSVQGVQRTQARLALGLALLAARQCTEAAMHLWHALHGNGCTVLTGLAADEATRWGDEEIDRDSGFEDWVSQQYYRARKQCPVDHKCDL